MALKSPKAQQQTSDIKEKGNKTHSKVIDLLRV